jgi:hypothetical protein
MLSGAPPNQTSAVVEWVARLEASIRDRIQTDRTFINWFIYVLLLSWITFGIAGIYYYYRRMARIDAFSRRKARYYEALVEYTERWAASAASSADLGSAVARLRADLDRGMTYSLKPIGAGVHFLLTIVTLGVWAIAVQYIVNRAWDDRQRFEAEFDEHLSHAWLQLGLLRQPIVFRVIQAKRRNFWIWLLLGIVTFGIGFIVWDYVLWTDPDRLYLHFHEVEDSVLQLARAA